MRGNRIILSLLMLLDVIAVQARLENERLDLKVPKTAEQQKEVYKKILDNGLTILVRPVHTVPKVSLQMWYKVGSKDEKTGEKGIAHLIEHMIFKGTQQLSESDINFLVHKLSGNSNAFTSYDYTGFLFNLPSHNWEKILPVVADMMRGASFKDEHLNSEMKAVIQELKMYRDNYQVSLIYDLITSIFPDHPYHYPIIGYKQDLWSVRGEDLRNFYLKHYLPNNATLVVVGDVNPEHVFTLSEKYFGHLEPDFNYKKEKFYHNKDIAAKGVTLYRDVKQPEVILAFVVPGTSAGKDHVLDALANVLGSGKASRLYNKIVDELKLATNLDAGNISLFDYSIFLISFDPKHVEDIKPIIHLIQDEIKSIIQDGISNKELLRAVNQSKMKFYRTLETTEKQAYELGKFYVALEDEEYIYNYLNQPIDVLEKEMRAILKEYFRPSVMHVGKILPIVEDEKEYWKKLQEQADTEDTMFLSARPRTTEVESPKYAHTISTGKRNSFNFPKAQTFSVDNGLKVLYYATDKTPKIDLVLEFQAKSYYEPKELEGIYTFLTEVMTEGTEHYSASELAQELESRGMKLHVYPGGITMRMPREEFKKGLEFLDEVLRKATFDEEQIEKVREQLLVRIKNFWDEPKHFANLLIKEKIYKDHPYSMNPLGRKDTVEKITKDILKDYYKKYITPQGSKLAIVGDLEGYNVEELIKTTLGTWKGSEPQAVVYPALADTKKSFLNFPINRDQVVLALARLSVNRTHPEFDKLSIFDQIFGFGALGSMASRLFQLREQSGLFYTINGTLVSNAAEEPGMFLVKTIVSKDRLEEAEKVIDQMLRTVVDSITPAEFEEAKEAILSSLVNNFESNQNIAQAFLFLDRYGFPVDYFDKRAHKLEGISLEQMKKSVSHVLKPDQMFTLRVGRVEE